MKTRATIFLVRMKCMMHSCELQNVQLHFIAHISKIKDKEHIRIPQLNRIC